MYYWCVVCVYSSIIFFLKTSTTTSGTDTLAQTQNPHTVSHIIFIFEKVEYRGRVRVKKKKMIKMMLFISLLLMITTVMSTNVGIKVDASWSRDSHSEMREAIEFVASADRFSALSLSDTKEIRDKIIESSMQRNMFDLVLKTGTYMPSVQFYADIARESRDRLCPESSAWIKTGSGKGICSSESLSFSEISNDNEDDIVQIFSFDHKERVYDDDDYRKKPLVILYGTPGTLEFLSFHTKCMEMRENIRYIFRQAPPTSETSSIIRGWGVTMDIKNMEYKALDDRPLNTQNEEKKKEEETNIEYDEEIEGFLFQTLQKRYPQHRDSMESLRRELLEQVADSASEIKVWVRNFLFCFESTRSSQFNFHTQDLQDIELQATQHILNAKDPLRRLQHVSQNFPSHAKALTRLQIDDNLSKDVKRTQQTLGLEPGQNILRVNGLDFDIDSEAFDLHGFLTDMVSEIDRAETRERFRKHVGSETMERLDSVSLEMSEAMQKDTRLDFRQNAKGKIIFLNNLLKDKRYKRWSKSLHTLMRPSYRIPQVARHLYTLIAVVDPTSTQGQDALNKLFEFVEQDYPIRVGVVFSSSTSSSSAREISAIAHLLRSKDKTRT